MKIDTDTEFGRRVERRLRDELMIWLTTVDADGMPEPSPVWFLWDGEGILVYSQPNKPKLHNVGRNPKVALNFDGNGHGGDVVVLTGTARIDPSTPPASAVPAYVEKYRHRIAAIRMSPDTFARAYSVPLRITPTKLRGH